MPRSPPSSSESTAIVATSGSFVASPAFRLGRAGTRRSLPGRSVTSASPPGRNAIPHGTSNPATTVSSFTAAFPSGPYPFFSNSHFSAAPTLLANSNAAMSAIVRMGRLYRRGRRKACHGSAGDPGGQQKFLIILLPRSRLSRAPLKRALKVLLAGGEGRRIPVEEHAAVRVHAARGARAARQTDPRAGAQARRLAGREIRPAAPPRAGGERARAVPPGLLPLGRVGLPRPRADHRHPLLPGRSQAAGARALAQRPRGRARDPHVPAPRGGPRLQLRLRAVRGAGVDRAVRALRPPVCGVVYARPFLQALRPPHRRVVRAEAPGRGLRGDVRRVAHAALELAPQVRGLAGAAQARVRRPHGPRAGPRRAEARTLQGAGGAPGRPDDGAARGVLPAHRSRRGAEHRRPGARRRAGGHLRSGSGARRLFPRRSALLGARKGAGRQDRVLDRDPPVAGEEAGRADGAPRARAGPAGRRGTRDAAADRGDSARDDPGDELPSAREVRGAVTWRES